MWDENKVRIVDVADALGLSTATVSNVIHGKTRKISDRTVRRVQEKLNEMGYIPNMAATLLAQNNSHIIGIVVNDHPKYEGHVLEDPFVCSAINSLSDEIEKAGYFLMLKKVKDIMDTVPFSSMWNMDGMILLGFCADEYQVLRDRIRIPFVVYDGFFENDRNICNLMLDDHDGGRQVGEYLRKHNCLDVIFIADNRLSPDFDRYTGLCDGLERNADFWEIPMHKEERRIYYTGRIKDFAGYDAVFAASDYYAIELLHFLMDHGYRVPEDIWIIGFDDIADCINVRPTLASVRQDVLYRARKAVEYLTYMKKDNDYSVTEKIPVEFIPRGSCEAE
ncbi:MAG: LacI family DNA-binding transcriptional regulator [Oscillospiraceae bacterium]|jgi:LacI family transcriptional regulator|nr:LacI family DNA-binding transcriptional regulator [Oscillospiraceae bacterium]